MEYYISVFSSYFFIFFLQLDAMWMKKQEILRPYLHKDTHALMRRLHIVLHMHYI